MKKARVAIVMGSDSDWATMQRCDAQLRKLGLQTRVEVMSAHRGPDRVHEFANSAAEDGVEVIIAAAGMAAALAGTIAACTTLPVIGVPIASGPLQGIDALLSTVQMPPGVPVATVGIGAAGATNAAILAAQIIAGRDEFVAAALRDHKAYQAREVAVKNRALQDSLPSVVQSTAQSPGRDAAPGPSGDRDENVGSRPKRLKGAMSTFVGHTVPEPSPSGEAEAKEMEKLAALADRMSESDHQALQEILKKLKA